MLWCDGEMLVNNEPEKLSPRAWAHSKHRDDDRVLLCVFHGMMLFQNIIGVS